MSRTSYPIPYASDASRLALPTTRFVRTINKAVREERYAYAEGNIEAFGAVTKRTRIVQVRTAKYGLEFRALHDGRWYAATWWHTVTVEG